MSDLAVILAAAGRSTRYGGTSSKLLESLGGRTVFARSYAAFASRPDVACIVVATAMPDELQHAIEADAPPQSAIPHSPSRHSPFPILCPGGASRAESVLAALRQVPERIEWVAVHDAARPLVSPALIDRTFAAAQRHGTAVPALPVSLTIKQAAGPLPAPVQRTVPRASLWAMQTPQILRRSDLVEAFDECSIPLDQVTDDAQLMEMAGKEVWLVEGEERNVKITTPMDLRVAEMWLGQ